MKKFRIGKRLLAGLLALIMVVSLLPLSVLAALGDLRDGETGLDKDIDTRDTISWPIKIYDYLNDGLLFEYAAAQDSSLSNLGGDAYGGGAKMPGKIFYEGEILGSDFTVNSTESSEYYDGECYDYWFRAKSNYNATYAQQGSGTAGAFKFLRLRPWLTTTNMQDIVISDFTNDRYYYLDGTTSYPRDRVRYAVVVYKTAVSGLQLTLGMSTNRTGSKTVKDYNNSNVVGPNGYYVDYDVSATQSLQVSNSWNYLIVDMKSGTNATVWNDITKVYQITLGTNMENSSQDLDLSHIAYFSDAEEAVRFAEAAKAFSNNPGEYLPDQYYTANGSTYSKHWNMGNNQAFTMLYASSGGGWQNSYTGGTNSWENGYYSYQIGKHTGTGSWATGINGYRNTAKSNGYPVSDNIFLYSVSSNKSHSLSQYDFGYTLFNEITSKGFAQVMTAGLLQNDLISVKGVDGQTYRIPEYKQDAVEYIAKVLQQALAIGQKDRYGNYNYNFVQGSVSSQFADANGNKRDLASALREALGLTGPSSGKGNYTVPSSAKGGSYAATKANQEKLIGPYALVKGNIKTFYDAAFYLMHNLFVDDSYNQLQNDYNYLVLSKAPVTETGKEAYVFDAGFTTGNIESDSNSTSAVVYNKENGTISLNSAVGKDEICYGNEQWTTRNPFLPVTDAEGDYGCTGTPYFRDDGARIYADYGNTYVNRNYNYVMQANAEFVYHYQDDLFFQFEGDDDVYLFVNGELVLDIGAAHSITAVKMQMNDYVLQAQKELSFLKQDYGYRPYVSDEKFEQILDAAEKNGALKEDRDYYRRWHHLNLVDGENYPIDFYYMERHGWGANMRVATNILMTDPSMITEKKAYQDGAEIKYGGIVDETELVEYGFSITNEGNNKLYNLTFNDYELGLTLSPEKGLSFANANINGTTLCDARGQKLDPNDLIVYVTGYEDEEKTKPVSIRVRFDSQDANGELKQFLCDLSSNDGTDDEDIADLFAGNGLWRHGTVTVRGIYYRMTQEQIEAEEFNNIVFTTANPAVDSDLVLNSADTHQIRLIGDARHIYQWREHDVYFTRDDLVSWLGGSVKLNNKNYSASQIKIDTCRKDGTTYDFPDIIVRNNQTMTVNYWDAGTQLFFIKVFRDTNNDGVADDLNSDGKLNETDFMIVPLAVFVTDLQDDAVVLDYGLKAELTGKNGIISNDYITVPNLNTGYSIMGMGQEDPAYLSDTSNLSRKNYNRISFKPVDGRSIAYSDGIYEYTVDTNDDKLYFTPNDFMDEEYSVYIAVTVHELDINPSAVGGINSSSVQHSIDITKEVQMYQKVTVLPATVMYYENDFPGLIYESDIEAVISGTGSHVLQQGVDQSVNYGADQTYQTKDNAQFSGNSMTAIRVTEYGKLAQFTFKGTGFEILSRTNAFDSASFVVVVRKDGKAIRTLPVITEFSNADSSVCKHTNHNTNGHCSVCGTYVGHVYYQDKCSKCGQNRLDYYLVGYINGADYGCESDYENMGHYKFVNGKLTATFKTDGYVFLKTTGNTSYFMTDGYPGANVTSAYFYNTTSPGLEADKLHVPGGVELTFTLVENNDGTLTLSYTTSNDDVTDQDKIVYFNNTDDWSEVYAYYWSNTDATMVDWPGVSMTRTEDKDPIYTMELPADAEYVIFTDGGSNQTMDLTVPADKMVYSFSGFNKGWSVYNPGKTTLNFDNSASKWSKVYIHYWSDQDKQMIQWPGVEMTAGADNIYTTAIPSNATAVLFHNGDGTQTADLNILTNGDTYIYGTGWASQESGDAVRTVYFKNTANWGNLHVHYWEEGSEGNLVAWPGDAMIQQDGDIYKASIPANATHVIFNNGTDTAQTMNLELQEDLNLFVYDKAMAESVPTGSWSVYGSMELPDEPETVTSRRVYLINTGNWSVPYAHYWVDGGESTSWPGVKMTRVEGNLYSVEVSLETDFIIFNNGSGTQTGNLPLIDGLDTYDYQKNIWSGTETKTIYLENNTGWATPYAYFWIDGTNLSSWPGVLMTQVSGNRYSVEVPVVTTKIIFNNGSGSQTADLTLTSGNDLYNLGTDVWSSTGTQEETPVTTTRTVYYDNNNAWEKVYVYYWALGNESMIQWPGVEMTVDENGIYAASIPGNVRYVIFNNFAGGQTSDLTLPTDANYYSCPAPACGTWEQYEAKRVLYFDAGSSGWSKVNAYYWSMSGNPVGWPGVAMTKVSDTLYSITVPYNAEKVIFNDGSGNQTLDLTITDAYDKYSLDTGLWSCTTRVIYFEGSGAGSVRLTYSSDSMPAAKKIMTRVKNNIYRCEIPAESKYVTFEDGTAVTGPVILSDDHDLYTADGWQVFDPAADYRSVIYFENTQGWEDVYVHYWGANINATTWPGLPMTFVDDRIYMINVPAGAEGVVFNNGDLIGTIRQTVDLTLPEGNDLFTLAATGANGTWSKYAKTKNDAIHQVPALRVDGLELGEYTVEIQGMPTYTDDVDWTHMQDFVKETYLYIDGIRIYQPLGSTHEKYLTAENGATVQELRNLILEGHAAVAVYDHGTTAYTGNVSWTENRNGTGGDMETVYMGNQLSGIDDYLLLGPNNETYLNGNAQTQAVIFYVKETEGKNHALQIAARGIDSGLFLGSTSAGVNATLYHGVYIENPDGTIGYGWRPMDTVLSGTEQYYTVKYQDCPYLIDENGTKIYQIALFVRNGMVSFTNVKFVGLDLQSRPVGDATELQMYNGTIYVEDEENGIIGGSQNDINKLMIGNKLLSMSIQMNATQWIEEDEQAIALKYPALSFEDEIYYNVFFTLPELTEQPVEMGLLMFDTLEEDGTIYDAAAVISGVTEVNGMYVARSQGIQAKDLGKTLYFRVFAQLADGSYVYSKAASYSARQYAKAILEGDYSAETKSLIAAMLKYSEAARSYFGGAWTLGDLITEDVDALVTDYRTDLLANAAKPDAAKAGIFAATSTGFTKKAPAVSFDGAFAINYFFTPSTTVQGDMTLYYWDAEDYENAAELTADNATGSMVMTPGDRYSAAITDIAAKDLDSTYYVAVVYQSNGQTYCSGVLAYSLASYCNSKATAEGSIGELAKATAVYGYHAKQLFG